MKIEGQLLIGQWKKKLAMAFKEAVWAGSFKKVISASPSNWMRFPHHWLENSILSSSVDDSSGILWECYACCKFSFVALLWKFGEDPSKLQKLLPLLHNMSMWHLGCSNGYLNRELADCGTEAALEGSISNWKAQWNWDIDYNAWWSSNNACHRVWLF